jgi:hypothetical protein
MRISKRPAGAWLRLAVPAWLCLCLALPALAAEPVLRTFPVGPIYDFRWQVLALALRHPPGGAAVRLEPYDGTITQRRSLDLLDTGELDVLALGSNPQREARALPVRVDILRGIIGFRVLLIRREDQAWFDRMDDAQLRRECTFGLQRDWADLAIMEAAGFRVETAVNAENLFRMLALRRFDGFPRGLNEARSELERHQAATPGLAIEAHRALYFPYPVYFWVRRDKVELAGRIQRGLEAALADGSFQRLFQASFAAEIAQLEPRRRHVLMLRNPELPAGAAAPDTGWWWPTGGANRVSMKGAN